MKRLAAMSGDIVILSSHGVLINGVLYPKSQPLSRDAEDNAIPRIIHNGTYQLAPHIIWLMGDSPKSWDSRYYGPISQSTLLGIGTPLLTKGARSL
jgi:conjugative transfer signal peptidase TraF